MNVDQWRASTSVHPKASPYLHLLHYSTPCFLLHVFIVFFLFYMFRGRHRKGGAGRKFNLKEMETEKGDCGSGGRRRRRSKSIPPSLPQPSTPPLTTFLWGLLINQPSISIMPPKLLFVALRGRNNQYVLWGQRAH